MRSRISFGDKTAVIFRHS